MTSPIQLIKHYNANLQNYLLRCVGHQLQKVKDPDLHAVGVAFCSKKVQKVGYYAMTNMHLLPAFTPSRYRHNKKYTTRWVETFNEVVGNIQVKQLLGVK